MVNLLFIDDDDVLTKPGIVKTLLRPGLRHRRDALGRRGPSARAQPAGPARGLRPGAERRDLRHLPLGHDAQGPGRLAHRLRQLASPRTTTRASASTTCSPTRRSGSSGRRSRTRSARRHETQGLQRPLRRRAAAHQRRLVPLPAAHDLEDEAARGGRLAARDRLQRLAAVHRRRRLGRVGDPPLDHRERLARGRRRAARPALLQHRHLHLLLGRHQPQDARAPRQGPARRRPRVLREDAQVLGEKRKEISAAQIEEITRLYGDFAEGEKVKIFPNEAFGFLRITVERPLRLRWEVTDETIAAVLAAKADPEAARGCPAGRARAARRASRRPSSRRERELVKALGSALTGLGLAGPAAEGRLGGARRPRRGGPGHHRPQGQPRAGPRPARQRERAAARRAGRRSRRTRPSGSRRSSTGPPSTTTCATRCCRTSPTPGSTTTKTKIGYEIPLTRHFYKYVPPRPLEEIDAEIKALEDEIQELLARGRRSEHADDLPSPTGRSRQPLVRVVIDAGRSTSTIRCSAVYDRSGRRARASRRRLHRRRLQRRSSSYQRVRAGRRRAQPACEHLARRVGVCAIVDGHRQPGVLRTAGRDRDVDATVPRTTCCGRTGSSARWSRGSRGIGRRSARSDTAISSTISRHRAAPATRDAARDRRLPRPRDGADRCPHCREAADGGAAGGARRAALIVDEPVTRRDQSTDRLTLRQRLDASSVGRLAVATARARCGSSACRSSTRAATSADGRLSMRDARATSTCRI